MARKQKPQPTTPERHVTFLLDETGSMASVRDATISGFNEYINGLKSNAESARFTLVTFSSKHTNTLYTGVPLKDAKPLNVDTYSPDGTTPLYDAIAWAVKATEEKIGNVKADVLFVVMTDGEENASKQYNRQQIFDLIKKKEAEGWTFAFLGANQDSWETGRSIGVSAADSAMDYNPAQPKQAFGALGLATADYFADPHEAKSRGIFHRVKKQR